MSKKKSEKNKSDLEKLIKQNIKQTNQLNKKIENLAVEIRRIQTISFIRFLIVTIPIILALLYFIPLFRQFVETYQPLMDFINQLN